MDTHINQYDNVNNPKHYNKHGIECIDAIQAYDDIPTSVADFVLTASGKSNIKEVPMKDINGFVEMMEGVDSGK
jgi:hypothetical protein